MVSCKTDIIPRPSKSTLMIPNSSQSSLSHCATTRPGMDAFSNGTMESSWPWQMIIPTDRVPAITTGQVDVNVRPAFAALREKALEENIKLHRIDCGNAQTKTNGAIGGAAASLCHNLIFAAVPHDVCDNQEVSCKSEL